MKTSQVKRRQTLHKLRSSDMNCIYCDRPIAVGHRSVEHMPPRSMFLRKDRPMGLEFISCKSCNEGTKAADAAVAFFSRIDQLGRPFDEAKTRESIKYLLAAESGAPGLIQETLGDDRVQETYRATPGGILLEAVEIKSGPIGNALLTVFGAKLGMAMYSEHVGDPLPREGGVQVLWFLNAGLSESTAHAMLAMLPTFQTLEMGKKSVSGQFDYRFNSDDKSIVACLAHFHGNVHIFTIATSTPDLFGLPKGNMNLINASFVRPGELLSHMPPSKVSKTPPKGSGLILPPRFKRV